MSEEQKFRIGQQVVYPSHGVGEVVDVEVQNIADTKLEVYVISFPQDQISSKKSSIVSKQKTKTKKPKYQLRTASEIVGKSQSSRNI